MHYNSDTVITYYNLFLKFLTNYYIFRFSMHINTYYYIPIFFVHVLSHCEAETTVVPKWLYINYLSIVQVVVLIITLYPI